MARCDWTSASLKETIWVRSPSEASALPLFKAWYSSVRGTGTESVPRDFHTAIQSGTPGRRSFRPTRSAGPASGLFEVVCRKPRNTVPRLAMCPPASTWSLAFLPIGPSQTRRKCS